MRPTGLALAALLLAGCFTPPADETGGDDATGNDTTMATPTSELGPLAPPVGERMPNTMERFVMQANQTLGVRRAGDPDMELARVAQTLRATSFWEGFVAPLEVPAWPSFPLRSAFETTGPIDITLSFSTSAPATSVNPRAAGFPPVGLWLGTTERFEYFLLATEAPDTLEAGKVYTVKLTATPPNGGWFVRDGEQPAIHPFLAYQAADGSAPAFVVGGPDPAGFVLPHEHFNLSAMTPFVLVDESGELSPNPGPTSGSQQEPANVPFTVPPEAVYVVLEVAGAANAGGRIDVDVAATTPGGERIIGGSSPHASETTVVGPGNLAAYGRDLVAHITASSAPAGGTYALKVTAYAPFAPAS